MQNPIVRMIIRRLINKVLFRFLGVRGGRGRRRF